jgi:hypothetical protein
MFTFISSLIFLFVSANSVVISFTEFLRSEERPAACTETDADKSTCQQTSQEKASSFGQIRITGITAYDEGSIGEDSSVNASIDVVQDDCGTSTNPTDNLEPFFDTYVGITVVNNSLMPVHFRRFRFRLKNANGSGKRYRSRRFALVGGGEVPNTGEGTQVLAFMLRANDGRKFFPGRKTAVPEDLGIRNVKFWLIGKNTAGKRVRVSIRSAFVFRNINRC